MKSIFKPNYVCWLWIFSQTKENPNKIPSLEY